jgi:hypothetical protein
MMVLVANLATRYDIASFRLDGKVELTKENPLFERTAMNRALELSG